MTDHEVLKRKTLIHDYYKIGFAAASLLVSITNLLILVYKIL